MLKVFDAYNRQREIVFYSPLASRKQKLGCVTHKVIIILILLISFSMQVSVQARAFSEQEEFKRALRFRIEGKSAQAIKILKHVSANYPGKQRLLASLYIDGDRFVQAISILNNLCAKQKDANCYNQLALSYLATGKYKNAEKYFQYAVKINPHDARLWSNLALTHVYLKKYNLAEKNYIKALKIKPAYETARLNRGVLFFVQKKYSNCLEVMKQLLAKNKNLFMAELYWGSSLLRQGFKEKAVNHFTKGIDLNPFYFDLYYYRAQAYLESGQLDLALLDLSLADRTDETMKYKTDAIRMQIKGFR